MPKEPIYKCSWANCNHPSRELQPGEGVQINGRHYHEDCAHKARGMTEIRDYYYENIDKTVVMKQLVAAIKNLVLVKGVDPDLVVFALKYANKNGMTVRSPYSMHYLVTSYRIKDAWERYQYILKHPQAKRSKLLEQAKQIREQHKKQPESVPEEGFNFELANPKSFTQIFDKQ